VGPSTKVEDSTLEALYASNLASAEKLVRKGAILVELRAKNHNSQELEGLRPSN
jgi:hypothetical protein